MIGAKGVAFLRYSVDSFVLVPPEHDASVHGITLFKTEESPVYAIFISHRFCQV